MKVIGFKIGTIFSMILFIMVTFLCLPSPVRGEQIVNTDKDTYNVGEKIKVNFSNAPGNDGDWISIVPAGSPDTEGGDYKYMPKGLGQGFLIFDPPSPGKYETRAYYNYSSKGYVVAGRHAFSVVSSPAAGIVKPAVQDGKPTRDDYVLFQTVTFGDANKPLTGFSTSGSLAVVKTPKGNMVDYELWTQGRSSPNTNKDKKEFVHGPVRYSRNPTSEEVSFSTKGFGLVEDVVNQILRKVEKNSHVEGTWHQEVSLDLLESYLPRKLTFHFNVQKVELKPGVQALLIRTYTDVFMIDILPTATDSNNGVFSGMHKGVLVYSPEDHRMYQMASEFDARKGDQTLQIQETAFLAGPDGKPVFPLLDMREALDLKKPDQPAVNPIVSMPRWTGQALKVQQVVSLASATNAERASNPVLPGILAEMLSIDGVAGWFGISPSSSVIEAYAATHGGPAGQLATRFLGNLVLAGVGEVLPSSMLLAPVLPLALTATSLYTIYDAMAGLGALVYYDQVLSKIEPFRWPQCAPMDCLAQADKAYALKEPYQFPADPGPPPEPPPAPKPGSAGWVVPVVVGGAVVIGAGVALGLSGSGGDTTSGGSGSSDCANYTSQVSRCCTTSGGIQFSGFLVPNRCGNCPTPGSTQAGTDSVTSGGPYRICDCTGC